MLGILEDPRVTRVREALADLGDTPESVAKTLGALGIRGERGDGCGCPVALYLRDHVLQGAGVAVSVGPIAASWKPIGGGSSGDFLRVPLPSAVVVFVLQFDTHQRPELEG